MGRKNKRPHKPVTGDELAPTEKKPKPAPEPQPHIRHYLKQWMKSWALEGKG